MELEFNGKLYWVEWDSLEEIDISDEDGNDVEYNYELYCAAEELVRDHYIGRAEMMMDMARDQEMVVSKLS